MKILMLNQSLLAPELQALGHEVISAGLFESHFDIRIEQNEEELEALLSRLPSGFVPDWLLYHDNSGVPWLRGLEYSSLPKIFYSIDTHHHHGWHCAFSELFDLTLVAQKDYVSSFRGEAQWLPPWAPVFLEPAKQKTIDVCFRGTLDPKLHPKRADFFNRLQKLVPVDCRTGPYAEAFPFARIVVNQAVSNDLNFRVFETLMSGALLITPQLGNGLSDLFKNGQDLVLYEGDNERQAAELIQYYLTHEEERQRIAESGRQTVLSNHTKEHRAKKLEQYFLSLPKAHKPTRRCFAAACSYLFSFLANQSFSSERLHGLLDSAVQAFRESAKREEPVLEADVVGWSLLLSKEIRNQNLPELEQTLFRFLAERYPLSNIAQVGYIDVLVRAGRRAEALSWAQKISTDPETLLAQAEQLMADIWQSEESQNRCAIDEPN